MDLAVLENHARDIERALDNVAAWLEELKDAEPLVQAITAVGDNVSSLTDELVSMQEHMLLPIDQFAKAAVTGICAQPGIQAQALPSTVAAWAYALADAMIAESKRRHENV